MKEPLRILFLCRANVVRSYLAAEFLRHELNNRQGSPAVSVVSRGIRVSKGESVPPEVTDIVAALGGQAQSPHTPTQVNVADLNESHLVLVAEKGMGDVLLDMAPASAQRTFSLIEFGRMVTDHSVRAALPEAIGAEKPAAPMTLSEQVLMLNRYRGYLPVADEPEDIDDPAGKPRDALYATAHIIERWTKVIADWCVRP